MQEPRTQVDIRQDNGRAKGMSISSGEEESQGRSSNSKEKSHTFCQQDVPNSKESEEN